MDTLERVWQSVFKTYNQVLGTLEGKRFNIEHTRTRKRQSEGLVLIDRDAYDSALKCWIEGKKAVINYN